MKTILIFTLLTLSSLTNATGVNWHSAWTCQDGELELMHAEVTIGDAPDTFQLEAKGNDPKGFIPAGKYFLEPTNIWGLFYITIDDKRYDLVEDHMRGTVEIYGGSRMEERLGLYTDCSY